MQGLEGILGGTTLAGAALEATLIAMLHLYGDEVESAGQVACQAGKPKPLLTWKFHEMLRTTIAMRWLPHQLPKGAPWNTRLAKIGDYAEVLQQTRNLIHPARYLQDHSPSRVTRRYVDRSIDVLDIAVQHLNAKVHDSLRRTLNNE